MKVLALDIEASPILAWTWSLFKPMIPHGNVVKDNRMICYSAQWVGSKTTLFASEYHDGRQNMLKSLHRLLDEADVVIGYNIDGYDIPYIRGEFISAKMTPPSPYRTVDLFRTVKQSSRLPSKKLDSVAQRWLDDKKVTHTGMQLWLDCIGEDVDPKVKEKAWNLMRKYAKHDTALLLPLYELLRPWIKNLPNANLYNRFEHLACPACTSTSFQSRGTAASSAGIFPQYRCNDCGKWFRGAKREATTEARNIP